MENFMKRLLIIQTLLLFTAVPSQSFEPFEKSSMKETLHAILKKMKNGKPGSLNPAFIESMALPFEEVPACLTIGQYTLALHCDLLDEPEDIEEVSHVYILEDHDTPS